MTPNELMNKICKEADEQTVFYKEISSIAETKNKLKCIELLINHFDCDFDSARIVMDYVIDATPLPSNLSPQEHEYNNAVALEALNKPHCPTCNSTNIQKIGAGERIGSVAMLGLFSKKINKSFKCKNCGYTW